MKRHRILQISCYMLVLGISLLFCFVPACKFLGYESSESPAETDTEDVKDPVETDTDTDAEEEEKEDPVETDVADVEDPVETDAEEEDEDAEDPVQTDAKEEEEDPVETDAKEEEEEEDPKISSKELRYAEDTLIFFQSGRYRYLARVTKDTDTEAKEVPVHIFVEPLREDIGDSLPIDKVRSIRKAPSDGWGTRRVALEYFENAEWTFSWDVQEMENHYLLPGSDEDKHRVEFTEVRFRIPVQR